ncbi:hypothetical protein [Lignipirellula cremea]|uniref:Peptidase C-terminal archaeal/bacterial domain-containing protein n=1 Tax=Lignipirellula cremea TaxID=2528010 RepID=A0A518DZB3_9BACT|nr:hypothetical protein [Lignipirellula cremea]QDU97173.1 hypothetical protein Pla8534_50180 [Lignipirellula cremea]
MPRTMFFDALNAAARLTALLVACVVLLSAGPAWAQLNYPQLTSIYPPGGKQGSEVEVTIAGANLDDTLKLMFSHPGLTASAKMNEADAVTPDPQPVENQFVVSIAADTPPGIYEVRTVGRYGISNPQAFQVGVLTDVLDDNKNKKFDTPTELPVGSVATGRVDAGNRDYWKTTIKKGERVLIECAAQRLDSRMDAALILYDAAGRELDRSRDVIGMDPLIDFTAEVDGDYIIAVFDYVFDGGADYTYRLAVHNRPHIDFIFPPSGLPGSNNEYTIYGRNLPGGKPSPDFDLEGLPLEMITAKIQIPDDPDTEIAGRLAPHSAGLFQSVLHRVDSPEGASNGVSVAAALAPLSLEKEPNDGSDAAQMIQVPCEFVGQFYPRSDSDWIQFEAKKGEVYNIEVYSHRLGLDVDPYMMIQKVVTDDKGEVKVTDIGEADDPRDRATKIGTDFDISTDDPSYRLEVKEDAVYRILLRDQAGSAARDPRNVYRMAITREAADFAVVCSPAPLRPANANIAVPSSLSVRKGGVVALDVNIIRYGGYEGEIEIQAENLPPGVTCQGAVSKGPHDLTALVFEADEKAVSWAGPIRVYGVAKVDGAPVRRRACGGSMVIGTANRTNALPEFRLTRDLVLAVVDKEILPVQVTLGDGEPVQTVRGAKIEVPAKVLRRDGYKDAFKLSPVGLPAELKPKDLAIAATGDGKLEIELTNAALKPGAYTFYLRGDVKFKYAGNQDAVEAAKAEQARLDAMIKDLTEKAKTDAEAKKTLALATAAKKKADASLKTLETANKEKDLTYWSVSTPVRLVVADSPVILNASSPGAVKQGEKVEIPVSVERGFDFEDAVDCTLVLPSGVAGLTGKLSIPKGMTEGKLEIAAAANATVGEHELTLSGATKFNNVTATTSTTFKIKVEAADKK